MMGSRRVLVVVGAVAALTVIVLGARALLKSKQRSEEEIVLGLVQSLGVAAEKRDVKLLRQHLSKRYKDERGRGHAEINQLLTYFFLRRGTITVFLVRSNVEAVDRNAVPLSARVSATAVLTRGVPVKTLSDVLPESARALRFALRFQKEDDETWRLVSASWRDAGSVRDFLE